MHTRRSLVRSLPSLLLLPSLVLALALALVTGGMLATPAPAAAFCGFYVSGADASLYSNATMVVLMRDGRKTVLSMQNNYQGPPEDFAMVVPVPVVLQEENVKTLPREVFGRVDSLAAPRLVEYWETDPCFVQPPMREMNRMYRMRRGAVPTESAEGGSLGVRIEAQFSVAEYDIVVLSANDSSGLDTWLRRERYNIPQGAEAVLRPYVEAGTKFFVAKVDVERVTFVDGRAVLSPLRFHYDADEFSLPVRLGLLNSSGQQDLLVHVLARGQRYEVANYENVTIPTNIVVDDAVRHSFGELYDLIFRRATAQKPRAVVTEYAWDANSCDPCPVPALDPSELMTLGADVIGGQPYGFVLTRLHYRYGREGLNEDLVFRPAPAIIGGRGIPDQEGHLEEESAREDSMNNFQGRYVILHPWEGEIACASPVRGRWGGPPGQEVPIWGAPNPLLRDGLPTPERPENVPPVTSVGMVVRDDVPAIAVVAGQADAPLARDPGPMGGAAPPASLEDTHSTPTAVDRGPQPPAASQGGCASCSSTGDAGSGAIALALVGLAIAFARPRGRGRPGR